MQRLLVLKQVVCIITVSERARGHVYKVGLVECFTYSMCQKSSEMPLCDLCTVTSELICLCLVIIIRPQSSD
jgi:hypothetical protein